MNHRNPLIGELAGDTIGNCRDVLQLLIEHGDGEDRLELSPNATRGLRQMLACVKEGLEYVGTQGKMA